MAFTHQLEQEIAMNETHDVVELIDLGDATEETRDAPGFERPDEIYGLGPKVLD